MTALYSRPFIRQFAAILAAALMLCLTALWNGQPFLYPDTPTYLRGAEMGITRLFGPDTFKPWLPVRQEQVAKAADSPAATEPPRTQKALTSIEDKVVLSGRSVYYGALVYAGYLSSELWLTVALQALSVAYVLYLLMVRLWGLRGLQVVGVAAALSLLTPLGIYTGFLMPDVFAPLVLLSIGALTVYWPQLPRKHRWALSGLLLFSLTAHASHLALAVLMLALLLLARLLSARWRGLSGTALLVLAGCIVGALAGEWAFTKAVTVAVGAPPLRLPHPMARLIDMGPGTDYLKKHCPEVGYAACNYVQNYPTKWDNFLFSTDPATGAFALADAATKRRLSNEQLRFVVDVLRNDPVGVISGIAADVVRQLSHFQVDIWGYGDDLAMYAGRVPASVLATMQNSRAARPSSFNQWLTLASYGTVLASVALPCLGWWRRSRANGSAPGALAHRHFIDFAWIVIAGVITNAIVCATLASSLDRFQARVIWLLPFLAMAALARATTRRTLPSAAESHAATGYRPSPDSSFQGAVT